MRYLALRPTLLAALCLTLFFCTPAVSQTATDDQIKALTDQKSILQLQADIANLQKSINQSQIDAFKAQIGSINTANLPTGSATLNNVDIQPTILAYSGLRSAIRRVANDLYGTPCTGNDSTCKNDHQFACPEKVVFKVSPLDDIALFRIYSRLVDMAAKGLEKYEKPPATPTTTKFLAPVAAFAVIDAAVSLASLFKTDVTIAGVDVATDDDAARYLLTEILRRSCDTTVTIIIDGSDYTVQLSETSQFLSKVNSLSDHISKAQDQIAKIQSDDLIRLDKQTTDLQKQLQTLSELKANITKTKVLIAGASDATDLKKLRGQLLEYQAQAGTFDEAKLTGDLLKAQAEAQQDKAFVAEGATYVGRASALVDTITKPDASGNVLLLKLLRAETLEAQVLGEPTLTLHVARMGGNNITKKNLFYTSIQFAGGAVVRYQLKDPDGIRVLKAGTEGVYRQQNESDHLESNP